MTPSRPKLVPKPSPDIACKKLILPRVNERKIEAGIGSEDVAEDSARRRLLLFLNARLVRDGQGQETGFVEVPAGAAATGPYGSPDRHWPRHRKPQR